MILRPRVEDLKVIGFYLGKIILGLAATMFIPILVGLSFREINPALDFFIGIEVSVFEDRVLKLLFLYQDHVYIFQSS